MSDDPTYWHVYCDGTALPNPGRIGIGVVLVSPNGDKFTLSEAPAVRGCNNEAEAAALIAALKLAQQHGATKLKIRSDSIVVVEQTTGKTRTQVLRLVPLFAEARALLATFEQVDYRWIARKHNTEADTLARAALGLAPKAAKSPKKRKRKRNLT